MTDDPTWIIDPIDGTTNFVHAYHESCISVGLTICKEPVIGIIYNPYNCHLYTAKKNEGAFFNDVQIKTSSVTGIPNHSLFLSKKKNYKNKKIYFHNTLRKNF